MKDEYGLNKKTDRFLVWSVRDEGSQTRLHMRMCRMHTKEALYCIFSIMKHWDISPSDLLDYIMERSKE